MISCRLNINHSNISTRAYPLANVNVSTVIMGASNVVGRASDMSHPTAALKGRHRSLAVLLLQCRSHTFGTTEALGRASNVGATLLLH